MERTMLETLVAYHSAQHRQLWDSVMQVSDEQFKVSLPPGASIARLGRAPHASAPAQCGAHRPCSRGRPTRR